MSGRESSGSGSPSGSGAQRLHSPIQQQLHQRSGSVASKTSASSSSNEDLIILTPYPVEPGHTLVIINRLGASDWRPEMRSNASFVAEGDNAGIVVNKPASIMDYNKIQAGKKERQQPPSAKMSFKVFLINSETNKLALEHRTLRFWLDNSALITHMTTLANNTSGSSNNNNNSSSNNNINNGSANATGDFGRSAKSFTSLKQESSQLAQAYFCQLIGSKPDEFPKNYAGFIMKLMRLLKSEQFSRIIKMEVELRQLSHEEHSQAKPSSPVSSIDGSQSGDSGRGSPLTSQRVLDIIESSYPNPISIKEICSTTQTDETVVRRFVDELASREKISSTDNGQNFTRTTKPIDTKINMVKQMPTVNRSQQPVIAIITAQYCEKLAVDSMISDKETFVRYRVTSGQENSQLQNELSANYVYTLGNIGDHRVVSTKLTSVGHSRGALIAAGNATTRLLGTFPEIEFVFLVGCAGGVANYTDYSAHVRLGDIVVSHLPTAEAGDFDEAKPLNSNVRGPEAGCKLNESNVSRREAKSADDFVYVHCRPKLADNPNRAQDGTTRGQLPASYSVHKNLKSISNGAFASSFSGVESNVADSGAAVASSTALASQQKTSNKVLNYDDCHFRLCRPAKLDLQELAQRLWLQGLENAKHRIWEYYIDEGIKTLKQQDIDALRPTSDTDKLYMSIGLNDTIEVSHPEAADDEIDLRRQGKPMCHFGPIGSGRPALANEQLKQRMISEFNLRAFDSEFDQVVESIFGNRKESYIMIRGISDYKDGRKRKEWQQYSALVAAAYMKSIIVNLKPINYPAFLCNHRLER